MIGVYLTWRGQPRYVIRLILRQRGWRHALGSRPRVPWFSLCLHMSFPIQTAPPNIAVVRVGKALDFRNAADFKSACQQYVKTGTRNFILDFSGTGILDSTGLGAIFSLYRQLTPLGGMVVFASVSRPVQVVVQLTRTYKVFRQFPTVEAAHQQVCSRAGSHASAV
jgi:anti-sigma B factor antagonist